MYNYLSNKTADYAQTLNISPQVVLPEVGDKTQWVHPMYDGSVVVVSGSDQSYFTVEMQWGNISSTDATTLMDWWHNTSKANGRENTFYWTHPVTARSYTVRFLDPLGKTYRPGAFIAVDTLTLRIEGNKP